MNAILWDMDDTLLETLPDRMKALAHAYEVCLGSRTDPMALWRSHRGGTLEALGQRLLGSDAQRFVTTYRDCYYNLPRDIRPYDGVREVLEFFLAAETPMAVVTSKLAWGATDELSRAGILHCFQAVVGSDDTDLHKPDPEPVYAALDRMLIDDAEHVVFVGDSPADIFAARNAGCRSVAALWGTLDEELLRDTTPDHVVSHPSEIRGIVLNGRAGARP
jgi:HAD superfamily hydrolase (TIGR01509 family)